MSSDSIKPLFPPDRRRLALRIALGLALAPFLLSLLYAAVAPPVSTFMLLKALTGAGIDYRYVPLERISPELVRAVIASEDARFCLHHGVDWDQMQTVVGDALDDGRSPSRGASTIPMQTAKNLFLWPGRSVLRKGAEIPLALWIDLVMSKRRIMEIYLNIAEWGPGIYGAEAAAQAHFHKSAKLLSRREAALLAASLPNPLKRIAGKPSPGLRRIAGLIGYKIAGTAPFMACVGL